MRSRHCAFAAVMLYVAAISAPARTSAAPLAIFNLGTLGGSLSWGAAINNNGQITGTSHVAGDFQHGFFYTGTPGSGGMMHDLGTLGGPTSQGWDINDNGQIAGASQGVSGSQHAIRYTGIPGSGGIMHDLGTLGAPAGLYAVGFGINNSGQVVGTSFTAGRDQHAFLYTGTPGIDGIMHDLGTLGGDTSEGWDINDSGHVVGWSGTTSTGPIHAFLYTGTPGIDGVMHDLGTLGGQYSEGYGINNSGQVVGTSTTTAIGGAHAFVYTGTPGSGGMMHDLGTLGGESSVGLGLNDRGQVVGTSDTIAPGINHAFLYTGTPGEDGRMIDLDAWLDAVNPTEGARWGLFRATGLNDHGMIVGWGVYDDGPGGLSDGQRAFLLDASSILVVPEPSNLALLLLAIPALLRRRHRTLRRANHGRATRQPRFEALEDRCLLSITVDTLTDELDGSIVDGDVSLRDAIAAAPVGETIDFSVTGAIHLTLGQLTMGQNLTVIGPGANQLKIDAGGASRVLEITAGTVGLSGLTLTGGNADPDAGGNGGGGVHNNANTTLTGVAIEGNTAYWFGGGAYNAGTLTIADSTISGNSASDGGGVYNGGSLTIKNSTISGNTASAGGGVSSYLYTSTTIANCTISGNSAFIWGGGIVIWHESNAWLSHTLITGNSAPEGREILAAQGFRAVVHLNAFNLIGDSSETTAQALDGVTAGATDILATSNGTNPTALAAILSPLANSGGATMTHALVPGGPAINTGNPSFVGPPNFDQRGAPFVRVVGGRIDIGAFEVQAPPATGDFDGDGDVDGRDFLAWQRNPSVGLLNDWQEEYGSSGELSVEGGEPAISDFGLQIAELEEPSTLLIASSLHPSLAVSQRETASDVEAVFEDSYVENVDRAVEQLAAVPSGVRDFGEMVARRAVRRLPHRDDAAI